MRNFGLALLVLATVFLIGGCGGGKEERFGKAPRTSDRSRAHKVGERSAPKAEVSYAAEESSGSSRPADKSPVETASIPERDLVESAASPDPEPADELRDPETKPAEPKREVREHRQQIRAGTLTAGSLNDHKNLDDYREYLSEAGQSTAGRDFPPFRLGERVMIEVKDSQGNGISDAQVTVTQIGDAAGKDEGVILDTWTRADGQVVFSTGFDAAAIENAAQATYELTVRPPGGKPMIKQFSADQSPWVVELEGATGELPQRLDLALVIDTTGSMGDELNYLKIEIDHIARTIHQMYPNVDQRYALICYRDEGDDYVVRNVIDFTSSLQDFRMKLAAQSANGGGDMPEAMHLALEQSTKLNWRRENTARMMFLVADAPPHDPHIPRAMSAVSDLRHKGVAVYPLAASGVRDKCEFLMRAAAYLTRGQYLFLTDHSGVGNPHAKPHAPKYEVEPLNQLMIRMIASELSGKEVLAKEIIATEGSDGSEPPPIPEEQNQTSTERHSEEHHPAPHSARSSVVYRSHQQPRPSAWDSGWFRVFAAAVLIAGILYVDHRMRT